MHLDDATCSRRTAPTGSVLHAISAATAALGSARDQSGRTESMLGTALGALSVALGASRACLCIGGRDRHGDVVRRYVTGGVDDMAALGPGLVGVAPEEVPEWDRARARQRPLEVRPVPELSTCLRDAVAPTGATWMVTTALPVAQGRFASLSVLGRGDPAHVGTAEIEAVGAVADILTTVLDLLASRRRSKDLDRYARLALDLVDEGVMLLDPLGIVMMMNRAAERQLGCSIADLDPTRPVWDQIEARMLDDTSLRDVATSEEPFAREMFGPSPMRVIGRYGLVIRGDLTVRAVANPDGDRPLMLAIFEPARTAPSTPMMPETEPASERPRPATDTAQRDPDASGGSAAGLARAAAVGFTPRELQVLSLLLDGHRVPSIAKRLYLSPHTVRNQLKGMFRKAHVNSQAELVEFARDGVGAPV